MSERTRNRFVYATLIDLGYDPARPEILLELGMDKPVDWDAVGDGGDVICRRLDFVLTVDRVRIKDEPLAIHFTLDRLVKIHDPAQWGHVYVLALRPTRDKEGRECDRIALDTVVGEAKTLRGRSWCADIGEVRISWRHAPEDVIILANDAFESDVAPWAEPPKATDDEVLRMCDAFDAFCDQLEAPDATSSPCILLDERDIEEFSLDEAVVEPCEMRAFA